MEIESTPLAGVTLITPTVHGDSRGFFLETWHAARYVDAGITLPFVQDNHSRSARGILRGLHLQTEQPQGKLVQVLAGAVFDVVVDCRKHSASYGKWHGVTLSAENHQQLWVPPGCAHGFYVLSDYTDFLYKCTDYYRPESEVTLAWNDPHIGVEWSIPANEPPQLSDKDHQGISWAELDARNHAAL
ncbi:MAG: dTDP-4-dehydrorhamnose 3,5-epimerase [Luminiphilus sp.]|jgi:dTDP-4-dehydrorhamnose 3,5-epimerase|nr:dTDP-4-dehydrorhamnose 3,5-epimerase [Luminiphilus sp.]